MTRRIAFILVALIALGLFAGSAAAQVISGEQFIVVRYYAGDVLVKTITVTPDGRSLQTVPNAGLVGSIDTAKAYLVEGKIETPIGLGGGSTGTGGTGLESRDAYLIGPEDRLAINVWENEQLTRDVPVRPDGMISMPLLGDIHAAGMTTTALKNYMTEQLKRYIENPVVTVTVAEINSYKAYVQGNVNSPGEYKISGQTTVTQVISLAGGFNEFADQGNIRILRPAKAGKQTIKVNYKRILKGKDDDERILPGDTVVVP